MPGIFGDETIPVPAESPEEGHDEAAAVDTESEAADDINDDVDAGTDTEELDADSQDSEEGDEPAEHSDELLAGKYKTTDDLVRGYKELERQFHQGRQQPSAAGASVVPQPGEQPDQQPDINQVYWERFRDDPLGTQVSLIEHLINQRLAPINEERQTEIVSRHLEDVAKEYGQIRTEEGLGQLRDKVQEIAEELGRPELVENPTPRILRMAAQEAFGDTKAQAFEKGKQIGRAESERTRQSKQGLGAPNGARRQPAAEPSEEDSIKAGILAAGRGGGLFG